MTWSRRFCVIDKNRFLTYKSERDSHPQLNLVLTDFDVACIPKDGKKQHVLRLSHPGYETYLFSAETRERADVWLEQFNKASLLNLPKSDTERDSYSLDNYFMGDRCQSMNSVSSDYGDYKVYDVTYRTKALVMSDLNYNKNLNQSIDDQLIREPIYPIKDLTLPVRKSPPPKKRPLSLIGENSFKSMIQNLIPDSYSTSSRFRKTLSLSSYGDNHNKQRRASDPFAVRRATQIFSSFGKKKSRRIPTITMTAPTTKDTTEDPPVYEIILSGCLNVKSSLASSPEWGKRYCRIKLGMFECYRSITDYKYDFCFPLQGCEIAPLNDPSRELGFCLLQGDVIKACVEPNGAMEQGKWVSILVKEIGIGQPQPPLTLSSDDETEPAQLSSVTSDTPASSPIILPQHSMTITSDTSDDEGEVFQSVLPDNPYSDGYETALVNVNINTCLPRISETSGYDDVQELKKSSQNTGDVDVKDNQDDAEEEDCEKRTYTKVEKRSRVHSDVHKLSHSVSVPDNLTQLDPRLSQSSSLSSNSENKGALSSHSESDILTAVLNASNRFSDAKKHRKASIHCDNLATNALDNLAYDDHFFIKDTAVNNDTKDQSVITSPSDNTDSLSNTKSSSSSSYSHSSPLSELQNGARESYCSLDDLGSQDSISLDEKRLENTEKQMGRKRKLDGSHKIDSGICGESSESLNVLSEFSNPRSPDIVFIAPSVDELNPSPSDNSEIKTEPEVRSNSVSKPEAENLCDSKPEVDNLCDSKPEVDNLGDMKPEVSISCEVKAEVSIYCDEKAEIDCKSVENEDVSVAKPEVVSETINEAKRNDVPKAGDFARSETEDIDVKTDVTDVIKPDLEEKPNVKDVTKPETDEKQNENDKPEVKDVTKPEMDDEPETINAAKPEMDDNPEADENLKNESQETNNDVTEFVQCATPDSVDGDSDSDHVYEDIRPQMIENIENVKTLSTSSFDNDRDPRISVTSSVFSSTISETTDCSFPYADSSSFDRLCDDLESSDSEFDLSRQFSVETTSSVDTQICPLARLDEDKEYDHVTYKETEEERAERLRKEEELREKEEDRKKKIDETRHEIKVTRKELVHLKKQRLAIENKKIQARDEATMKKYADKQGQLSEQVKVKEEFLLGLQDRLTELNNFKF